MIGDVGLAVVLFASTNIDDLFVLLTLVADRRVGTRGIVVGQYLGIASLFAFSVGVSMVSLLLLREQTGLLGIIPILIGLGKPTSLFRQREDDREGRKQGAAAAFGVAAITIANGGRQRRGLHALHRHSVRRRDRADRGGVRPHDSPVADHRPRARRSSEVRSAASAARAQGATLRPRRDRDGHPPGGWQRRAPAALVAGMARVSRADLVVGSLRVT